MPTGGTDAACDPARTALRYGVFHALTDAVTVAVVFRAVRAGGVPLESALALVVAYDLLAFAGQLVLGWAQDRWYGPRAALWAGAVLGAVATTVHGVTPMAAVVLAGTANALVHLGAGASVLRLGLHVATPAGLFVAPGALGLGVGLWLGRNPGIGPLWPLGMLLLLVLLLLVGLPSVPGRRAEAAPAGPPRAGDDAIAPRAPVQHARPDQAKPDQARRTKPSRTKPSRTKPVRSPAPGPGHPAGCSGAAAGLDRRPLPRRSHRGEGLPAQRLAGGRDPRGGVSRQVPRRGRRRPVRLDQDDGHRALVSAPLVAVPWSHPVILLAGLLAFQMTMPVTLVTVARLMPTRLGTAFGWTCFALALGSLPAMFDWGGVLSARPMLFGWILVAAVAVFAGLTLAEVGDRDRGPGGGLATRTITGTGRDGVDECPAPRPSR